MHSMKKRTMEKEHQAEERRKKVLMEIAGAVVVLTVIVSIVERDTGQFRVAVKTLCSGYNDCRDKIIPGILRKCQHISEGVFHLYFF